ncbi:MAG: sulfite exporter TauE/SafE family protein [Rhodospirillaceae bacterium]
MPELNLYSLVVIAGSFALGGLTKGTFGLGMPMLALPVLVFVVPYQIAVALFVIPNITANLQQALHQGRWKNNLRRYLWLILPMLVTILFSVQILVRIEQKTGLLILGLISLVFVVTQAFPIKFGFRASWERWLNPLVGVAAGALCGISGLYGPILIVYLMAQRLPKEEFVSALSLMYLMGSIPLAAGLASAGFLTGEVVATSFAGAAIIGFMILIGKRFRDRLNEARYRKLILGLLFLIGCTLLRRALL